MKTSLCLVLLTLFGSILPFVGSVSANGAAPVCIEMTMNLSNSSPTAGSVQIIFVDAGAGNNPFYDHTFSVPGNGSLHYHEFISATIVGPATIKIPAISPGIAGVVSFPTVALSNCATSGVSGIPMIDDGRINAYDLAAPLAAYCADGGIAVWHIDGEGQGTLAFTATADQISAALSTATSEQQNQLVAEGLGDSLYGLMSNQIALFGPDVKESGKTYQFLAPADVCN